MSDDPVLNHDELCFQQHDYDGPFRLCVRSKGHDRPMSELSREQAEALPMAAEVCEHFYAWVSPAGARNSARLCQFCHAPDPEWLNHVVEVDRGHGEGCVHCEFAETTVAAMLDQARAEGAAKVAADVLPLAGQPAPPKFDGRGNYEGRVGGTEHRTCGGAGGVVGSGETEGAAERRTGPRCSAGTGGGEVCWLPKGHTGPHDPDAPDGPRR